MDLNEALLEFALEQLGLSIPVRRSDSFAPITSDRDPRNFIHPKKDQAEADPGFQPQSYHQVFSDRHGFQANLSILDLLFNLGPEALNYLQRCLRT
jgi:hypothetical protein